MTLRLVPDEDCNEISALQEAISALELKITELDAAEPEDMMSAKYEKWADRHEALEDELDDLREQLEALIGDEA